MLMKEMFEKEIDRDIQGVIIVGQSEAENVAQESVHPPVHNQIPNN